MVIACVASDNHLGCRPILGLECARDDSFKSFKFLVETCVKYKAPLILCGDVLDNRRPESEVLHNIVDILSTTGFSDLKLPIYFVQGQHDISDPPWLPIIYSNAIHLEGKHVQLGSFSMTGLDYSKRFKYISKITPLQHTSTILVTHQTWKELFPYSFQMSFDEISGFKHIWTGDIHIHRILNINDSCTVLSPGSQVLLSLQEEPVKKFFLIHDDLSVESVETCYRPVLHITVNNESDVEAMLIRVKSWLEFCSSKSNYLHPSILFIYYKNESILTSCQNELEKISKNDIIVVFNILCENTVNKFQYSQNISDPNTSLQQQLSILKSNVRRFGGNEESEQLALSLWTSQNPSKIMQEWLKEVLDVPKTS